MPFHQTGSIRYFAFDSLSDGSLVHAVITRHGGVSPSPWASLNVGALVGDDAAHVLENRQRSFSALHLPFDSLYDVWQVHSREVVCTDLPRPPAVPHLRADAILTDRPGVTLFMRFADCVPIFLHDPERKVVGLVHAGWQGTLSQIAAYAVQVMADRYGSSPQDIRAGIGPSIAAHHYPVGPEVAAQVQQVFGQDSPALLPPIRSKNGDSGVQFDLWAANRLILENSGVSQIELSGLCTACNIQDWYSHRGEKGRTGRFGALIALA